MQILSTVRQLFAPVTLRRTAAHIEESEGATARTIDFCVPTALAAILHRIATPDGAERFLAALNETRRHAPLLEEIAAVLSSRHSAAALVAVGQGSVERIFGTISGPVVAAIAEECQVAAAAAADVLALITVLMLHETGKQALREEWDSQKLLEALGKERRVAARALPAEVARYIELYEAEPVAVAPPVEVPQPAQKWLHALKHLVRA